MTKNLNIKTYNFNVNKLGTSLWISGNLYASLLYRVFHVLRLFTK